MVIYLLPLVSALLWAIVNYLDKYLIEKIVEGRGIGSLLIFSSLAGLPVMLIVYLFNSDSIFNYSLSTILILTVAGFLYLLGLLPYLYALDQEDTTSVAPQMLLIPFFSTILSYLLLNEVLTFSQIIGGLMLLWGAFALNVYRSTNIKVSLKVLSFMLVSSFLLAVNAVLFKFGVVSEATFWASIFWEHVGYVLFGLLVFIIVPSFRRDFINILQKKSVAVFSINMVGEAIAITGNLFFHYSTVLIPVGLANILAEGTQPFMVLFLGILLATFFKKLELEEKLSTKILATKSIFIVIMFLGILLIST